MSNPFPAFGTILGALPIWVAVGVGCAPSSVIPSPSCPFTPPMSEAAHPVDLLLMIQNSNSMRDNQTALLMQLGHLVDALTNPPCTSPSNPTPHACNGADTADVPVAPVVHELNLGVISPDLGTPGSTVPGCVNGSAGDDGLLNPIRNGGALQMHEPWVGAPSTYGRPTDCTDPNEYPLFIDFTSGTVDPTSFTHDAQCNAGLYVNGCGLSGQLEAVYRALITHGEGGGGDRMNAGFLRDDAVLAILMLSDREDGSVRDCTHANGDLCEDATDVYNAASTNWSDANLSMRFYMYPHPGAASDPTWPVERYIDLATPNRGFMSLKPGHPERIVFGAITGMPLDAPTVTTQGDTHPDWDQLLGPPGPNGPNDFAGRQSSLAYTAVSPEGPVSMRLANMDTTCAPDTRPVPSCRRRGTTSVTGDCTTTGQYYARPARRIVEVARRFDEATWCPNGRCGNGMAASICENDDTSAVDQFVRLIQSRLVGPCQALPVIHTIQAGTTIATATCELDVALGSGGPDVCDPALGRSDPVDPSTGRPTPRSDPTTGSRLCVIHQLDVNAASHRPVDPTSLGWYYDATPSLPCTGRVTLQGGAAIAAGEVAHLSCTAPCSSDGGTNGG